MSDTAERSIPVDIDRVIIRFAGDSGDGMQLTGDRFTSASALLGNDLVTLPEYPAEIRAPAGTVAGVSSFQVHISDHDITTPGDAPNVLVAMNPAALKSELDKLELGGTLIVNSDTFDERSLTKAGYDDNPLTDGTLKGYTLYEVPMTSITKQACEPLGVKPRDADRSKNFFALGLISWMYTRPEQSTIEWINEKFASKPKVRDANLAAFRAGHAFGETAELFDHPYSVPPAEQRSGTYTNISGNTAMAWGLIAASQLSGLPLFLGSYPITPASDILHELSKHKNFGVRTLQAEDEIAGIGAALGASFGGHLGVTTTSGPGLALKSETLGLAISLELPAAAHRHPARRARPPACRPRPSSPTCCWPCTAATASRRCRSSRPTARPTASTWPSRRPASRSTYRTPVIVLSDGYLANGAEPWRLPTIDDAARTSTSSSPASSTTPTPTATPSSGPTCAIPRRWPARWPCPARPTSCTASAASRRPTAPATSPTTPRTTVRWSTLRAAKVAGIAKDIPDVEVRGDVDDAEILLVGWGSTWGAISGAVDRARAGGTKVAQAHLMHLNPFPAEPRRGAAPLPQGAGARDEPRPAGQAAAGRVPRRRQVGHQGEGRALHRRRARASDPGGPQVMTHDRHPRHHPQGLVERPGGALVPRLR